MSVVTVRYLEMLDRSSFRPKVYPPGFAAKHLTPPDPAVNRRLYQAVGGPWHWTDRLPWSNDDWWHHLQRGTVHTWVGEVDGQEIGYFELEAQPHGNVEIAYFGLLVDWIGHGFGGVLLSAAIERAWALAGTRRLWLHTCSYDHHIALENYLKRGFTLIATEHR